MDFNSYDFDKLFVSDTAESVEKEFRYALFDDLLCQVDTGKLTIGQAIARHKWDYPLPALENTGEYGTI